MKLNKLNTLAAAVALLSGAQGAMAITPWTTDGSVAGYTSVAGFGTPDYIIYTSGGAAQDQAIDQVVLDTLAAKDSNGVTTLTIFKDATSATQAVASQGANFTGYYFIGSANLPANLIGKKVYFAKRSRGAAGYGVVPVLAGTAIDQLNIFNTPLQTSWTSNGLDSNNVPNFSQVIGVGATAALTQHFSHGGFLGVDSESLLLSSGNNYPTPVTEYSTNANTTPYATTWTPADLANLTRIPTGGLVYGVAVTTDLYKVLQAAQIANGHLPAGTTIGDYSSAASLPSLSRDFVASILAGKVAKWNQVEVNVGGVAHTLDSYASAAGVTAPTDLAVGVGLRNNGAAVGAAAYATFLNYPYAENSVAPAASTGKGLGYANAAPKVEYATGVSSTSALLTDWQLATNKSGLLGTAKKIWGLAINNGTSNDAASNANWRYVKIDDAAPTIEQVASGNYPFWAEGEVTIQANGFSGDGVGPTTNPVTSDIINFLTVFGNDLGSVRAAKAVDASLPQPSTYGTTGIFATPASVLSATAPSIPFDVVNNPYVALSHKGADGYTHLGIRPVSSLATNIIELK